MVVYFKKYKIKLPKPILQKSSYILPFFGFLFFLNNTELKRKNTSFMYHANKTFYQMYNMLTRFELSTFLSRKSVSINNIKKKNKL